MTWPVRPFGNAWLQPGLSIERHTTALHAYCTAVLTELALLPQVCLFMSYQTSLGDYANLTGQGDARTDVGLKAIAAHCPDLEALFICGWYNHSPEKCRVLEVNCDTNRRGLLLRGGTRDILKIPRPPPPQEDFFFFSYPRIQTSLDHVCALYMYIYMYHPVGAVDVKEMVRRRTSMKVKESDSGKTAAELEREEFERFMDS